MTVFDKALDYVFANEGGFSNVPEDRGGATRWGITREEASRWRRRSVSVAEMRSFPIEEAKEIYEAWYWLPLRCDQYHSDAMAIAMFDIGIVRGIGVPPKYAQTICDSHGFTLVIDGHIGPKTIAAMNAVDPKQFVRDFSKRARNGFLAIVASRPSQVVFIRGWLRRADRLLTLI